METLRQLLLDGLGARSSLRFSPVVAYGDDLPASTAGWRIVLFSLAQTPEVEVHGELLADLVRELADGQRLIVIIDEAPMLEKLPESQRLERRESRRRAWLRNLESAEADGRGPRPIFLALDAALDIDLALDALPQGMWPRGKWPAGEAAGSS